MTFAKSAQTPYAGSNVTGSNGLIAVDKVANKIRFYDPHTLREMHQFDAPEPAVHELAIAHDHRVAFVPLYGDGIYGANKHPNNKILVIDLERRSLLDMIVLGEFMAPHGMAASSQGKLWAVCDLPNKLILVDPARRAIEDVYDCPAKGPHLLALLPDESKLYVSSKEGDVVAFDLARRAFVAAIPMRTPGVTSGNGSGSEGLMPKPSGAVLIVIDNARIDLRVVDTACDREIDRVALAMNVWSNVKRSRLAKLMFSPDGRSLLVTCYASGLAWLLDASDYRNQTVIPVAKGPQGMAFASDGETALVSSHDSGLLTRIDLREKRAVSACDGGGGIEVLAYY